MKGTWEGSSLCLLCNAARLLQSGRELWCDDTEEPGRAKRTTEGAGNPLYSDSLCPRPAGKFTEVHRDGDQRVELE